MRHHGWELPYHPLQVTSVATFLALVFSFYIFFLPFVGFGILKALLFATYTPMAIGVAVLYIWCVAINPVDAHVKEQKRHGLLHLFFKNNRDPGPSCRLQSDKCSSPFVTVCSAFCNICMPKASADMLISDDILYCNLCKVEISKQSKHCRVCDKCVDGFDHHCRWLNNCIGRKNYKGFIYLIFCALLMFILQWSFGLWIIVHRLLDGRHFELIIVLKLGKSFSSTVYILVVASCSVIAIAATFFLGQLSCFHGLLIMKGISTYDYIIAIREQDVKSAGEVIQNVPVLSRKVNEGQYESSAGTGRASPLNVQPNQAPAGFSFTANGLNAVIPRFMKGRTSMKINPWALAFLKKEDIIQAATIARNTSSTIQPIMTSHKKPVITDTASSVDGKRMLSTDFIVSFGARTACRDKCEATTNLMDHAIMSPWQNGKLPLDGFEHIDSSENDSGDLSHGTESEKNMSPLQREARNVFKSSQAFSAGDLASDDGNMFGTFDSIICEQYFAS